jgi:aryl carrier-like protein
LIKKTITYFQENKIKTMAWAISLYSEGKVTKYFDMNRTQVINKMAIFAGLDLIQCLMLIERVANNQITISFSSGTDMFGIQRLIDYAKYLEATSKSKAKQSDVDKLADEINANWWNKNKHRFLK